MAIKPIKLRINIVGEDVKQVIMKSYDVITLIQDGIQYYISGDHNGIRIQSIDTERRGRILLSVQPHSGNVIYIKGTD